MINEVTTEKIKKEKKEVSWRAAEYEHLEKERGWFLIIGAVAFVLAVFAFWQNDFFFGVFIVLATALVMYFGRREPRVYDFAVGERGVSIGEKEYPLGRLESFSIRERRNRLDDLVIKKKTNANPFIHIPVDERTAKDVRRILKEAGLPETEYQESIIDIVTDLLGF